MSDLSEYFLNANVSARPLDLIEITHPNFSKPYRMVRNDENGVIVDLSNEELGVAFDFYPLAITPPAARDDTEASVRVSLGDVGETIATEIDNLVAVCGFLTKPQMRYWLFRSDVLNMPLVGPVTLEIGSIEFDKDGAGFEAMAPQLNVRRTGERYDLTRFPMLRGFVL